MSKKTSSKTLLSIYFEIGKQITQLTLSQSMLELVYIVKEKQQNFDISSPLTF